MKTKSIPQKVLFNFIITSFFATSTLFSLGTNPEISKNLVNLSASITQTVNDDNLPEMIIDGNTIHTLWVNKKSGSDATLYYCRSTDLGETWEAPQQIWQYTDVNNKSTEVTTQRLAVSGENVYIGICDYVYDDNGTGYIYLVKSSNAGETFTTPTEIVNSGGGYKSLDRSFIRAEGNNVAIAYDGSGEKEGVRLLFSSNNGTSFKETVITKDNNAMSDFLYTDNQLIVVYEYSYYSYGLSKGRVYVAVSNNNGTSFTTNKVSIPYTNNYGEQEKCRCQQDQHYVPKIVKDGNNIHLIFMGNNAEAVWSVLYTRSTNGGNTFEEAHDYGTGILSGGGNGSWFQGGQETITAKSGYVYLTYLRGDGKCYFQYSSDNGATFSEPESLLTDNTAFIQYTWWPQLVIDPSDKSGKTVYFGSGPMMTRKSIDGGQSFHNTTLLFPLFDADVKESVLRISEDGNIHWLSKAKVYRDYDYDIFYTHKKPQPEPGSTNKSYSLKTATVTWNDVQETTIVPSSESLEFDSIMTGEAWIRVKYDESGKINFFTKANGYDGYVHDPSGYRIGLNQKYGSDILHLCAGIETDKGEFTIEANDKTNPVMDSLWHHVAFTYDASAGLNNFKAYMDGLLVGEQTITGEILQGDGLFIIGSSAVNSDSKYEIDDIRLWNRALTQKELLENQTKKFTGEEDGLKLFLTFDDTFKDISGNGNDAIPLYLGELETSNFDPPITDFEMYQVINEISFNNKTTNATSWLWNFGDESTSEQGNPKYSYATAGEYDFSLVASNSNSVTSAIGHATILGLDRIEPAKAGNSGIVTLTVIGGGLTSEGTNLFLQKEGSENINGFDIYSPGEGQLSGYFVMNDEELGKWDVVVQQEGAELTIEDGFYVVEATLPEPWVSISGRGQILFNMWQTYTLSYGNKGNINALGVPLNFVISDLPGMDIEFIDFKVEANDYMKEYTPEIADAMDTLYDVVVDYFGPGLNARLYPLYIPVIEANSTQNIHIRIKSPDGFQMESWVTEPFFSTDLDNTKSAGIISDDWPDQKTKLNACIALAAADAASSSLMDVVGMVLPVDCLYDFGTLVFNPWDAVKPDHKKSPILQNQGYALASAAFSCIGDLSPLKAIKVGIKLTSIVNNMYKAYTAHQDCLYAFDPRYKNKHRVGAVSSFDPNEMIGPSGFGDENYIANYSFIPYTILFENKSEATAPAHIVTISDTLSLSTFNISEFGFSEFGWGDTIFSLTGNKLKEFSMDIDMRPETNLITRVSGKLDTILGVVNWEFLSLNPGTMDLEEDPFIGFLPPNITSPQGEAFVSFSVGIKDELTTNSEIKNLASIVFDANEPIITNEYLNTLDLDAPESHVLSLDGNTSNHSSVSWAGTDNSSGICDYSIYVMENDTNLYVWQLHTSETSASFDGEVGSTYKFYSIATDNVNHEEAESGQYDASTAITVDAKEFAIKEKELQIYPNPATDYLIISFENALRGEYVVELISNTGELLYSEIHKYSNISEGIQIDTENIQTGLYIIRIIHGNQTESKKITIK